MLIVLKLVVNYEALGLEESYQGTCFGHAFSECQYVTIDEKVYRNLKHVSLKFSHVDLQKWYKMAQEVWERKARME
jgi:hypothetical protein